MLELKDITKIYETKDLKVEALKGVSLKFRKNEFVSILGPSGCGKTTFLNIVGGLDKYTSGDLIINGKSTKDFSDRDWDSYRNHTIGFVFQSYNLIPHQTVLQNVEIALTLSGVTKAERRRKAVEALHKVGLGDKINSKPNQLSGGQMQRVAIARALVNDPDVVLADEPTGALDSKTSVQVMELLKEVAKDRLVIMVTHNPNLATEYSTRIIKFLDGELIDDSNPIGDQEVEIFGINQNIPTVDFTENVEVVKAPKRKRKKKERAFKKTTMSFGTALSLSFKNLLTKKARTLMVAIAGSIGIFGIALILALSSGFQSYINKTQEDTLASYPITINKHNVDPFAIMMSLFTSENTEHEADGIYAGDTMSGLFESAANQMENVNDLDSFSKYIEEHKSELDGHISAIQYTYDYKFYVTMNNGKYVEPNSNALYDMIMMYAEAHLENKFGVELNKIENGTYDLIITNATDEGKGFISQYISETEKQNCLLTTELICKSQE